MEELLQQKKEEKDSVGKKLKLGFLGAGWIGRNRMEAILKSGFADAGMILDPDENNRSEALKCAPGIKAANHYNEMLESSEIDGIVIATPSALHAEQSLEALKYGKPVFCQKPLGRTEQEAEKVVNTAKDKDLFLGVDLSYRHTQAMQTIYEIIRSGELGDIFSVDLGFHNAYGPDKPWFYDPKLSGGGCVIDLGVHLVDLALWCLEFPEVQSVDSKLFCKGNRIRLSENTVEDYATAMFDLENGTVVDMACSWNLQAGKEAEIKAIFYGTKGSVAFKNVNGSFYDFKVEKYEGTNTKVLVNPPDNWMGRAGAVWVEKLASGEKFNKEAEQFVKVAKILDRIYDR